MHMDMQEEMALIASARALKTRITSGIRLHLWKKAVAAHTDQARGTPSGRPENILIISSDPRQVVGSRGDDAMFSTVVKHVRAVSPNGRIGVICVSTDVSPIVDLLGLDKEPIWLGNRYDAFIQVLERYDSVIMIGADVMDGVYGEANGVRFWAMCDIAARLGKRTFVLGCSFSDDMAPAVKTAIKRLSPALRVYARDQLSKNKFDDAASITATLVSDSAFLLPPESTAPDHEKVTKWVSEQHAEGRFVCAFNTHPMIFSSNSMEKVAELNERLARVLPKLAEHHPVSFLLVPHDFRGEAMGDNESLRPLYALLAPILQDRLLFAPSEARANQLKALIGCADMLVTGRMHLGVGALSMGVPIWGLSPQDKFAGLFQHFGLPDQRMTPKEAEDETRLYEFLDQALQSWEATRDQVRATLPQVKSLSARNFESLEA
jgi:polysaccharide pyruvyl transferase WcaK-like protein